MIFLISESSTAFSCSAVIAPVSRFARASLMAAVRRKLPTWSARKGGAVLCILTPDVLRHLDDAREFRPLLVLGQHIAFLGRGKAALARQTKLIERRVLRGFINAALEIVL